MKTLINSVEDREIEMPDGSVGKQSHTDPRWTLMLQAFNEMIERVDSKAVFQIWSRYNIVLNNVRGIFVVTDDEYEQRSMPKDTDFGEPGKLRRLLGNQRLFCVQNSGLGRNFSGGPSIFCDTNFVSYCGTFHQGKPLTIDKAFREAVNHMLPHAHAMNPWLYMLENAERMEHPSVREKLRGFLAFRYTPPATFASDERFDVTTSGVDLDQQTDGLIDTMRGPDFKLVYEKMKEHHRWAHVTLLKAALLAFGKGPKDVESRMYKLLEFFHAELGRIMDFEVHIAHRFFAINSREPFFNKMNQNVKDLQKVLANMAWDLAHWRSLFTLSLLYSHNPSRVQFPVPYLLSFDKRFVELVESFRPRGILYSDQPLRCEIFYPLAVVAPVKELLRGRCGDLYTWDALRERQRRQASEEKALDDRLVTLESELTDALDIMVAGR